jgi:asparagine synthase (glutamine-hydrolysing)
MSAIWAYLGPLSFTNGLGNVPHRGQIETLRQAFESPVGAVRLQQCGHTGEAYDERNPLRSAQSGRRYSIVFDGCLYNRDELSQLAAAPLNGEATDAQILLAAFERLGAKCVENIDGAFAFVVWDDEEKRLYAVRDRFGLRPLYVYASPTSIAFASEIKQFFALPGTRARLNTACALDFLISGLTDHSTETMFENVYRLHGGAMLRLDLRVWQPGDALPAFDDWYQLPTPGSLEITEAEAVERFRHLLTASVRVQWQRPVPRALCLSGGLDSSSIAGILAADKDRSGNGGELLTFKARFGDEEFDETHLLKSVLELTGVTNYQTLCTFKEALRLVEPLAWHLDEPFSRASLAAQWMLFEQAAGQGISATLDGQGADEQLCGYASMIREHLAYLEGASEPERASALSSRSSLSPQETAEGAPALSWLSQEQRQATLRKNEAQPRTPNRSLGQLCRYRMLHGDLPMMMRQNDRLGAAHGIETHVPFMAHQVVEFSIALGDKYKLVGNQSKYLLRRAMDGLVPRAVLEHYHKGSYSKLEEGWLRTSADETWVEAVNATAREWPELVDEKGVRTLTRERASADKETLLLLWRILCFGAWARKFNVSH